MNAQAPETQNGDEAYGLGNPLRHRSETHHRNHGRPAMNAQHSSHSLTILKAPISGGPLTMSSREIAELTGKRHADVLRDIRVMLKGLEINERSFASVEKDGKGEARPIFNLPKRETMILVSGYSIPLRAAIVDRWQELEEQVRGSSPALPNFADPIAAARAWADALEAKRDAEQRALIADLTKAEIGTRREATAMNTASQAVKRASRLEIELDQSRQYASVKRMSMLYHGQEFSWRLLKQTSTEMGLPSKEVFDQNYGTVKAYHADVWREAYALDIAGPYSGEAVATERHGSG